MSNVGTVGPRPTPEPPPEPPATTTPAPAATTAPADAAADAAPAARRARAPRVIGPGVDTDRDLLSDAVERRYGLDPTKPRTERSVPMERGWDVPGSGYAAFSDDYVSGSMRKYGELFGGTAIQNAGRGYWEMYASGDRPLSAGSWIPSGGFIRESDFEQTAGVDVNGDRAIGDEAYRALRDAAAPQDATFALRDRTGNPIEVRRGDRMLPTVVEGGKLKELELRMGSAGAEYFDPATGKAARGEVVWRARGTDGQFRGDATAKAESREQLLNLSSGVRFDFLDESGDPISLDRAAGDRVVPTFKDGDKWKTLVAKKDARGAVTGYDLKTLDKDGKRVEGTRTLSAAEGKRLLDEKKDSLIYRIQTRGGALKGDGKVGQYYDMSWWGRCQNVASIDQSGLKQPDRDVKVVTNVNRRNGEEIGAAFDEAGKKNVIVPKRNREGKVTGYEQQVRDAARGTVTSRRDLSLADGQRLMKEKNAQPVVVARDGKLKAAELRTVTKEEASLMTALMSDGATDYKGSIGSRFYGYPDQVKLSDGMTLTGRILSADLESGNRVDIQRRSGAEWRDENGGILRGKDLSVRKVYAGYGQLSWAESTMGGINANRRDKIKSLTIEYPDGRTEKVPASKVATVGRENAYDLSPADLWKAQSLIKDGKSLTIEKSQGVQVWNYGLKSMGTERVDRRSIPSYILAKEEEPGAMAGTTDKSGRVYFKTDARTLQGGSADYYYWAKFDKDGNITDYNFLNGAPDFFWQSHVKDPVASTWDGEANVSGARMRDIQSIYNAATGALASYEVGGAIALDDLKNGRPVKP